MTLNLALVDKIYAGILICIVLFIYYHISQDDDPFDIIVTERSAWRLERRACLFSKYGSKSIGITLVTHLSIDKTRYLNETMKRWEGPVSACFFLERN